MSDRIAFVCVAAAVLASVSCSPTAAMIPDPRVLGTLDRIERAGLIVVGVVESETAVPGGRREGGADSGTFELQRVGVRVEGVIKGQFDGTHLSFFYYDMLGSYSGPPHNVLVPGQRAIFYLLRDGGILRATNDVFKSHTELVTGKHKLGAVEGSEAVRALIARVLLLPGEGMDINGYLDSLYVERAIALDVVGNSRTADLLRSLLRNSNGRIRSRACILLAQPPLGDRHCLSGLIQDQEAGSEDRKRALEMK